MTTLNINRQKTFDEVMEKQGVCNGIRKGKEIYVFNELKVPVFYDCFSAEQEAVSFLNRMKYRYGKRLK